MNLRNGSITEITKRRWTKTERGRKLRREANKRWSQSRHDWWIDFRKNLQCSRCPESDWRCLDFHHSNPLNKDYSIASKVRSCSTKKILEEVAKCEILCANCHRKLHINAGLA